MDSEAQLSSDAGLLPVRDFDERIGLSAAVATALEDPRALCEHPFRQMVRQRMFGILAGYEDQNDHDALRSDPVFKLIAGRDVEAGDLASQPTLSRFENALRVRSLMRLQDVFVSVPATSFTRLSHRIGRAFQGRTAVGRGFRTQ